jgi:hypothetical protein
VELLRRRPDLVEAVGCGQPGRVEQVLAVEEQLRPAVGGDRELLAVLVGQFQRPWREGAVAQFIHDGLGGIGVQQVVGGHLGDRAQG